MSTPIEFCHFFQGALAMAKTKDGPATFTPAQIAQIEEKLVEALETEAQPPRPNRPDGGLTRC